MAKNLFYNVCTILCTYILSKSPTFVFDIEKERDPSPFQFIFKLLRFLRLTATLRKDTSIQERSVHKLF